MRNVLLGFLLGLFVATAGSVWAYGHRSSDRTEQLLRDIYQQQERQGLDEQLDRDQDRLRRLNPC